MSGDRGDAEPSYISLNRLFFLAEKKIEHNTPFFVIEFVAKTIGVRHDFKDDSWKESPDSLIEFVNDTLSEENHLNMKDIGNDESLSEIASFVNPEPSLQWKKPETLIRSFWSIHNFTPKLPLASDEIFGYKTENTPNHIDPVMIYQIAIRYNIPFGRETGIEKIKNDINNFSSKLTPLRENILVKIKHTLSTLR